MCIRDRSIPVWHGIAYSKEPYYLPYSVSFTQSGMGRYGVGIGTVWGRYGNGMTKDWSGGMGSVWDDWVWYIGTVWAQYWSGGMGSVWDDWVWYTGAVWEQYWSGGMGSGVKRYCRKVADDALSGIFFRI